MASLQKKHNQWKHGDATQQGRVRLYRIWTCMKTRCNNPKQAAYKNYGARGIKVCVAWLESYETFRDWALKNGYAEKLEIDRKDNDGDYEPSNCHWVTTKINDRNKRTNFTISAFGETKCIAEWVEDARCVTNKNTLRDRILAGWSPEEAITKPHDPLKIQKSQRHYLTAFGEKKHLSEWTRDARCNVRLDTLQYRIRAGWNAEDALTKKTKSNVA